MNGAALALGAMGALAIGAAVGRRGSRAEEVILYHGGAGEVRSPRAGTFLTPDPETAATYARYGPNQHRRTPQDGVVSSYAVNPGASIQRFPSFGEAYAHYGVRSTPSLARAATRRNEADLVAVYDERILVRPAAIRWLGAKPVQGVKGSAAVGRRGSRSAHASLRFDEAPPGPPFLARRTDPARIFGPKDSLHLHLSPTTFLALTASPLESDWGGKKDEEKIARYAERMRKKKPPATFPIPWLWVAPNVDHAKDDAEPRLGIFNHEGRHRAAAALRIGLASIPVTLIWQGSGDIREEPDAQRLLRGESVLLNSQGWNRRWPRPPLRVRVQPLDGAPAFPPRQGSRATDAELEALVAALAQFWSETDPWGEHDPTRVYHGTTGRRWAMRGGTWGRDNGAPLHLSADPNESMEYAILAAQSDRDEGHPYDPRLYVLDLEIEWAFVRAHTQLDVDHGHSESVEAQWQDAGRSGLSTEHQAKWTGGRAWEVGAEQVGFFVLLGDTEGVKARMREVPRRKGKDGAYRWPSAAWRPA